jgi:hypothetical protein
MQCKYTEYRSTMKYTHLECTSMLVYLNYLVHNLDYIISLILYIWKIKHIQKSHSQYATLNFFDQLKCDEKFQDDNLIG